MTDREAYVRDFDSLIAAFIDIGGQLAGIRINPSTQFLYNAEGLGKKLINHIVTTRVLLNGYKLGPFERTVDFGSIAILARAALETYLTLNYLFVSPEDEDEKIFKLNAWYLGGLDRIKYKPAYAENQAKYEEELKRADQLKDSIRKSRYFGALKDRTKDEVLKGIWKIGGWPDLARKAGFDDGYFRKQYMFLSSYSHSNNLSVMQTQQIIDFDAKREMAEAFISVPMVVLGKYAYDYVQIMPTLKEKIDFSLDKFRVLYIYKQIGEKLNNSPH
jgi:hypothetical protein